MSYKVQRRLAMPCNIGMVEVLTTLSKTKVQALGQGGRKLLMICLMISWMG